MRAISVAAFNCEVNHDYSYHENEFSLDCFSGPSILDESSYSTEYYKLRWSDSNSPKLRVVVNPFYDDKSTSVSELEFWATKSNSEESSYIGIAERKTLVQQDSLREMKLIQGMELMPELSSYLLEIYRLEKVGKHRPASKVIFRLIETCFASSNLAAVNALMESIDFKRLGAWSISGLVRTTSRAKMHLPYWPTAFNLAKTELTKKGFNAEEVFAGIKG